MKGKGLIQVYTGDGKGKSTAAIGQAARAAGHGFKVGFVSFFKDPEVFGYGEYKSLQKLGIKEDGVLGQQSEELLNIQILIHTVAEKAEAVLVCTQKLHGENQLWVKRPEKRKINLIN